jgi:hypothetical protein
MNLKVADSRKRNRLQDREDEAMDGSSNESGSGSQEETTEEASQNNGTNILIRRAH